MFTCALEIRARSAKEGACRVISPEAVKALARNYGTGRVPRHSEKAPRT